MRDSQKREGIKCKALHESVNLQSKVPPFLSLSLVCFLCSLSPLHFLQTCSSCLLIVWLSRQQQRQMICSRCSPEGYYSSSRLPTLALHSLFAFLISSVRRSVCQVDARNLVPSCALVCTLAPSLGTWTSSSPPLSHVLLTSFPGLASRLLL